MARGFAVGCRHGAITKRTAPGNALTTRIVLSIFLLFLDGFSFILSSSLVMGRSFRSIDNESRVVEIESRTIQGRFLIRPSDQVNDLVLGVLGRAQARYEVELYAFVFMSNHMHLLMKALAVLQMSRFVGFLKTNISKELGRLHQWEDQFWGRRFHHASLADTDEDQLDRLNYIFKNGCKENLVNSPLEWPGASSTQALVTGMTTLHGTWYDRSAEHRSELNGKERRFPSTETVRLTPLPCLAYLDHEERRAVMRRMVDQVEQQTAERHLEEDSSPIGIQAVLDREPHSSSSEFHASPAPHFHAANPEDYWNMYYARQQKQIAYRDAAERLKRGELDVRFPEDCFPPPRPFVESKAPT